MLEANPRGGLPAFRNLRHYAPFLSERVRGCLRQISLPASYRRAALASLLHKSLAPHLRESFIELMLDFWEQPGRSSRDLKSRISLDWR